MPRLTVGILTRNRRDHLEKAIRSVYDQGVPDIELLVVDNASEDDSVEMVHQQFPNVRLIRLPRNLGCPGGRNHLYANATGDFVVNLDDDGWLGDGALQMILEAFESDPSIGIVALRQCYPEDAPQPRSGSQKLVESGLFMGGVSAFRRKMLDKIGLYPEDFFFFAEEEYLSIRALDSGYKIVYCPDAIMWHPRQGPSGSADTSWDYYRYRNPLLVVIRLFPSWLLAKYLFLRCGSYALRSLRRGTFWTFLAVLFDVFLQLPSTLLKRKACSADAVMKYLRLRGVR